LNMYQIAGKGLVRTFQLPTLFNNFTVLKNVLMGMHLHAELGLWGALLASPRTKILEGEIHARADKVLQEVGLADRKGELASNLPHGHRRVLQVAISLGCEPGLLLLDEPMTGMNVQEVEGMMGLIRKLRENRGITIVIVEHNIRAVMGICDRIAVLDFGRKIAEGTPAEISQNAAVIQAYLGGSL
jgi:branched-chain amino acid transport system ATP-binding protein